MGSPCPVSATPRGCCRRAVGDAGRRARCSGCEGCSGSGTAGTPHCSLPAPLQPRPADRGPVPRRARYPRRGMYLLSPRAPRRDKAQVRTEVQVRAPLPAWRRAGPADPVMSVPWSRTAEQFPSPTTSHRRSCASSVWQGAGTRQWPEPREPLLRCASTYLSMSTRRVTMYPRQAAARPPHYLLPLPSRRQPEAPAPSRNRQNWRDTIDKQGSKGTPHR